MRLFGRKAKQTVNQEILKSQLRYDKPSGKFFRLTSSGSNIIGTEAGYVHQTGYMKVGVLGGSYYSHRLVWLYTYGEFPKVNIDHIDGNPLNNCIDNLMECNQEQNARNIKIRKNNTSGFRGVC